MQFAGDRIFDPVSLVKQHKFRSLTLGVYGNRHGIMFDWLRKRTREDSQIERLVDDIESPGDPALAQDDQEHVDNVKSAARSAVVAAIVTCVVIAAAIFVVIRLRGGWPT